MNTELIVALVGVVGSIAVSFVTSRATRPKMNAEATAATTGSEVAKSADAREWVKEFRDQAKAASERADAAEARADAAEAAVDELRQRCDDAIEAVNQRVNARDQKINDLISYVFTMQRQIRMTGEIPAEPPAA